MSKEPLEVYPVGSSVLLDGVLSARVTAIFIREGVCYEVVWWAEGQRYCEEVEAWELSADDDKARSQRINPVL